MKVKELLKAFKDRGIHENMNIRIIVNEENPEDSDCDKFFSKIEAWGYGDDLSVDLFIYK